MKRLASLTTVLAAACAGAVSSPARTANAPAAAAVAAQHRLYASPRTVAWGNYDAATAPVLRIRSGEVVEVYTLLTSNPTTLKNNGVDSAAIEPALRAVYDSVPRTARGPGGHILTGPIYVEGADAGDVLEVRILSVDLAIPYAYNSFGGRSGFIPEDYGYSRTKIVPLDAANRVAHFAPGIDVPLAPFFGSMGVAPPPSMGKVNSAPPGIHAGNLDNKELVAGTTLFIPVHVPGALFQVGDGHAAQGNGEVDITALETSLKGTLQFIVRKDLKLTWPRAETPTHWIAMGIDKDLVVATKTAVRQAIEFLVTQKALSRDDAYMLVSVGCDVNITQLVDGTVGVHVMIPKKLFVSR